MVSNFPKDFIFGAATSSYQIEGSTNIDGRGESIWDRFCKTDGTIADKSDGSRACNHYQLWQQDVDLMADLSLQAYRFSIAWPRIQADGTGSANAKGLDFYSQLVDYLLEKNITPFATLYHWDLPQSLQDMGGWTNRDICKRFMDYTNVVTEALGDRVKNWITHNEPWVIAHLGYRLGEHAPGHKSWKECLESSHHLLLSHGLATPIIRDNVKNSQLGITLNLCPSYPASESTFDKKAARIFDGEFNRWYLDPLYKGSYPEDMIQHFKDKEIIADYDLDFVQDGDMEAIQVPTDFLGINYYSRAVIRCPETKDGDNMKQTTFQAPAEEHTDMGWEVYPKGLQDLLERLHQDYAPKALYITENGAAYDTAPNADGEICDELRRSYLESHISACHKSITNGVPLKGYFAWSLLDNFEWAFGYEKRFGLVWVDYETMERTPKLSAKWYRDLIKSQ